MLQYSSCENVGQRAGAWGTGLNGRCRGFEGYRGWDIGAVSYGGKGPSRLPCRALGVWQQGPPALPPGAGAGHRQRHLPQLLSRRCAGMRSSKDRAMPRAVPVSPRGRGEIPAGACAVVGGKAQGRMRNSISGPRGFAALTKPPCSPSRQQPKPCAAAAASVQG